MYMKEGCANQSGQPRPGGRLVEMRAPSARPGCPLRSAMKLTIVTILLLASLTVGASAADSHLDDALLLAARKALSKEVSTNDIGSALKSGLWNTNRTAIAVSFPRPKASVIFVFLRQTDGSYLAADASGVEGGNFGKLGIAGRAGYDRFETTPIRWLHREDGWFQVVMRTRAWKAGQRYTVSEPLLIKPDGTVLYR